MIYTIFLAASNQLDNSNYYSQLLPVHGKAVISWVIDYGLVPESKGIIVLDENNISTLNFLKNNYPTTQQVLISPKDIIKKYGSFTILHSLDAGLEEIDHDASLVQVILGDSLCRPWNLEYKDCIAVSANIESSERWCLAEIDNTFKLVDLFDKIPNISIDSKYALTGYYRFSNIELKSAVNSDISLRGIFAFN